MYFRRYYSTAACVPSSEAAVCKDVLAAYTGRADQGEEAGAVDIELLSVSLCVSKTYLAEQSRNVVLHLMIGIHNIALLGGCFHRHHFAKQLAMPSTRLLARCRRAS